MRDDRPSRSHEGQTPLVTVVWQERQGRVRTPLLDEESGLPGRGLRRSPDHRHRQYLQRVQSLPRPLPQDLRACEARRVGGGRLPARIPGLLQFREPAPPHFHAVPQPRVHGRGGGDPRPADGRRRAAGRLRQDHAGPADGRVELQSADHLRVRRPDAERLLQGREDRLRDPCLEVLRGRAGRRDVDRSLHERGAGQPPLRRPLHDHGHRVHNGIDGGEPGRVPAGQCRDPGRRQPPLRAGAYVRQADRRHGDRGPAPVEDPDQGRLRERHGHQWCHRWLDQCGDPPAGHRRPARRRYRPGRLGPARQGHALPGQPDAVGRAPDGGLLLRGRPAGGAEGDRRSPAQGRDHGQRQDHLGERAGRGML